MWQGKLISRGKNFQSKYVYDGFVFCLVILYRCWTLNVLNFPASKTLLLRLGIILKLVHVFFFTASTNNIACTLMHVNE